MFDHFKNIDSAFRHVRLFSAVLIVACVVISCYTVTRCLIAMDHAQQRVYVLLNGKALEAFSSERKDNIPVEARDHISMFHRYFFSLDPDDKAIEASVKKALYLADQSAKTLYDDLKEKGFYNGIVSGNISQELGIDSVRLNMDSYPYYFRFWGHQRIIRTTSIVYRLLVTEGYLRNIGRSDNNPHGFLIERWRILDNKDEKVEKR